ncbi:hypothetical protein Cni_G10399 [Canna indica]|uniref:ABC transporter domain-containing protein n=1 Tax=Canna indica TaxID=4628 RepID=A0AAQ3K7M7_9LILI|nr:hypothetical protein Cni_G10399 [Canna indica]
MAKPKEPSSTSNKHKHKPKAKPSSYIDAIHLPYDDEDDEEIAKPKPRPTVGDLSAAALSDKELKKRRKKDVLAAQAADQARQEALKDDREAFTVVIGSRDLDAQQSAAVANVRDISIEDFSVWARSDELLKDASLKISHGKMYGVVGPNGKGKSTLLRLLAWRKIPIPRNIDVLLVEQEVVGDDRTALEAVVSADEELVRLRKEVAALCEKPEEENYDDDDTGEKLAELYERLELLSSDAAEAQASKILAGLGFTQEMQCRPTKSFSGGWRMKISLARALFMQPTLLLLDEPTNHLDLRAVVWLEEYLSRWKKTLLVVSHDRDFLNTVCNMIIHLHGLELVVYRGNVDAFEKEYEKKRNGFKNKMKKHVKLDKHAKNAAANWKGNGFTGYSVEFHFPEPTELPPPLLQLIEVSFSYPNREDFGLSDVDLGIDMGTRVAIVGPNGAGKSTLLKLLVGDLKPTEGEVRSSRKLQIGRYSQHFVDQLTMEENPVEYLLRLHPEQEDNVRSKLGEFGLPGGHHFTPIAKLSGGQKARVVFTSISMSEPHILVLDEPTNHLDMQSIDALADALQEFTGGVVLVTHDSGLISSVCNDGVKSEIWVVEEGTVRKFRGSFEEYKEDLLRQINAEVDSLMNKGR